MGFDIMSLQKGRGAVQARSKADEGRAVLKYIDVDDLVPSEDNFYSMSAIDELAALIELSGGVKQPALVSPLGGGKYKVIAGHRRRLASLRLVEQGKDKYRKMPCMVEDSAAGQDTEADELRAIDEAILLITTNAQREKTDWDKVQEAKRLRELLDQKRQLEKISGETRKIIAVWLGTTPAQVGRYDSIEKHLIPTFKTWLEQGQIGISVAYELSILPEGVQKKAAAEYWGKRGPVTLEDVRRWKQEAEQERPPVQPGPPMKMVTVDEVGPAPTLEQMEKIAERTKERPHSGVVVVPGGRTVKAGAAGDIWVQTPAPPVETEQGEKDVKWAALMLDTLKNYCKVMSAQKGDCQVPWADYTDALTVAIAAMRKLEREKKEDIMTGEEIYNELNNYLKKQPIPVWAMKEFTEAVKMGITDGGDPMVLIPRYQAAIMAKQAAEKMKAAIVRQEKGG